MMLGSEKMLLSLGINAQKQCTGVLKRGDIKILDISVASRWNSQSIEEIFRQTERKVGSSPVYVVSDNDSKLVKAIGQSGYTHIRDISHTLALFSEGLYKHDEEFSTYSKCLSCVKIREVMRPASYLLPPRQRTIARFMNLSTTVEWSIKMQRCFGSLNKEEQDTFAFSNTHKTIINELSIIFEFINYAQSLIKTKGLSSQTIKLVLKKLNRKLNFQSKRIKLFNALVRDYLKAESGKLNSKKCIWNASSDIIESLFGTFKLIQGDASLAIGLLFAKKSGFHFE